jgi:hypothetical protein
MGSAALSDIESGEMKELKQPPSWRRAHQRRRTPRNDDQPSTALAQISRVSPLSGAEKGFFTLQKSIVVPEVSHA